MEYDPATGEPLPHKPIAPPAVPCGTPDCRLCKISVNESTVQYIVDKQFRKLTKTLLDGKARNRIKNLFGLEEYGTKQELIIRIAEMNKEDNL